MKDRLVHSVVPLCLVVLFILGCDNRSGGQGTGGATLSQLAGGGAAGEPGPQELNTWGHPIDKLRYDFTSWQRTTLLERMHMRR